MSVSTVGVTIFSAALLAMVGALFGVFIARVFFAEDLAHAQRLKVHWDGIRAALEQTIEHQRRTIDAKDATIKILERTP